MPQRNIAYQVVDRCLPGGLAEFFEQAGDVSVRGLPHLLAQKDLVDGRPFEVLVHESTLLRWRRIAQHQEHNS